MNPPPTPKTALITGGAQRIGRAIVEALAADGWSVAVHYNRSRAPAEELARAITARGGRAVALHADLSLPTVAELIARATQALGPLNLLVNNAALFAKDDAANVTAEGFDRHMAINTRAPLLLSRAFAAQARAGDCILNLLDQKLWNLNPDFLSYTVSKIALDGLTRLLAMALAPVRVVGLAPGLTLRSGAQTDQGFERAHRAVPLGLGSTLADITQAALYLVNARAITGETLIVDGGEHMVRRNRDVAFEIR